MTVERGTVDHICNVIRRQVQEEFRDLTLFFVVHKTNEREKTLQHEEDIILAHPAGKAALELFRKKQKGNQPEFLGLAVQNVTNLFGIYRRHYKLAAFYVNSDLFESADDARQQIYAMTWHVMDLLHHYKDQDEEYKIEGNLVLPKRTALSVSKNNLMADVFSVIMLELQDQRGVILKLAQKRAGMTLNPTVGYLAEHYPYPIALESTQLVYKDYLQGHTMQKMKLIDKAIQLAREVSYTHGDMSIKHWWSFSKPAQKMAWLDFDQEKILSAAIYTSEDPYVRATAHLIAEAMNVNAEPLTDLGSYNPFMDKEINERLHNKSCTESYRTAMSKAAMQNDGYYFLEQAHTQNMQLARGYPVGWCAHAMLAAAKVFQTADPESGMVAEEAAKAFHDARTAVSWDLMRVMNDRIMNKRRQGVKIGVDEINKLAAKDKRLAPIAKAFEGTMAGSFFDKIRRQDPKEVNITDYADPSYFERSEENTILGPGFINVPGEAHLEKLEKQKSKENETS